MSEVFPGSAPYSVLWTGTRQSAQRDQLSTSGEGILACHLSSDLLSLPYPYFYAFIHELRSSAAQAIQLSPPSLLLHDCPADLLVNSMHSLMSLDLIYVPLF